MDEKVLADSRACFPASAAALTLGAVVHAGECAPEPVVTLPLAMANRHGLIAGATGTGKTKTLQLMAEQFSAAGVPVFLADLKGDLSGLAVAGETSDRVAQRARDTGWVWKGTSRPVEFLSLETRRGFRVWRRSCRLNSEARQVLPAQRDQSLLRCELPHDALVLNDRFVRPAEFAVAFTQSKHRGGRDLPVLVELRGERLISGNGRRGISIGFLLEQSVLQ